MSPAGVSENMELLRAWARGDEGALEQVTPRVYDELRRRTIQTMAWFTRRPGS
jgi:hypothetical protein